MGQEEIVFEGSAMTDVKERNCANFFPKMSYIKTYFDKKTHTRTDIVISTVHWYN